MTCIVYIRYGMSLNKTFFWSAQVNSPSTCAYVYVIYDIFILVKIYHCKCHLNFTINPFNNEHYIHFCQTQFYECHSTSEVK